MTVQYTIQGAKEKINFLTSQFFRMFLIVHYSKTGKFFIYFSYFSFFNLCLVFSIKTRNHKKNYRYFALPILRRLQEEHHPYTTERRRSWDWPGLRIASRPLDLPIRSR